MGLADYIMRNIPSYYPTMYKDGYTPEQIMMACHKKMREDYEARQQENDNTFEVVIKSGVKVK